MIILIGLILGSNSGADRWQFRLAVENIDRSLLDPFNYFGVSPDANDAHGPEDGVNLFSPEIHYIDLYFPHDDIDRPHYWEPPYNRKYAIDIRNDAPNSHVFYFDIFMQAPRADSIVLFWIEEDSVSPDYCLTIGPLHGESTNMFLHDSLRRFISPGVHYFEINVRKNFFNRIAAYPESISLHIGEIAHLRSFLANDVESIEITQNSTWQAFGDAVEFCDNNTIIGVDEGISMVQVCFRGWLDTIRVDVVDGGMVSHIHLRRGWNLISLPTMPSTTDIETIFGESIPYVYGYQSEFGGYFLMDTIMSGEGFFVLSMSDTVISIVGEPIMRIERSSNPGWCIIGVPITQIPVNSISINPPPDFAIPVFGFDGESYFIADTIKPGSGYWIFLFDSAEITISP